MKKAIKIGLITILIITVAVCAWFIGYHTRKSQDNLPSLESIAEMDEADINDLLVGYRNYQLVDVWEDPDIKSDNTWIWKIDEHTQLQVSCNNRDKVVVSSLDSSLESEQRDLIPMVMVEWWVFATEDVRQEIQFPESNNE